MVLTYSPGQVSDAVDVLHLRPDAQWLTWFVHRHIGIHSQLALCGETWTRCTLSGEISLDLDVWQKKKERGRQRDREWFPYQTCCLDMCPGLAGWAGAPWQLQRPPLHSSCLAPSPAPLDLHLTHVKTAVLYISKVSIPWSTATNLKFLTLSSNFNLQNNVCLNISSSSVKGVIKYFS